MAAGDRHPGRVPLAWPAAGVAVGVLLGDLSIPTWTWAALGLAALALALRFSSGWALLVLGLAIGALREGAALAGHADALVSSRLVPESVITVRGEVVDRVEEADPSGLGVRRTRWRLRLSEPVPGFLNAGFYGDVPGLPGERLALTGIYRPPRGPSNPGGFDGLSWALHEGSLGSLSVRDAASVRPLGKAPGLLPRLREVREALRARLGALFPGEDGALLGALLLGVREPLDESLSDAFLESGAVHYLAISGAHLLLVLGLFSWAMGWTPLGLRTRAGVLIVAALSTAAMTGMRAPVLRVALVASLGQGALLLGRPRAVLNALAAVALIILLADPGQAFRAGFRFSFLAGAGILLMAGPLGTRIGADAPGRLRRYVLGGLAVSLAAWLSVIPLAASEYHLVTPVVLLANLAAWPLVAAVMAVGALAMLLPPLVPLAQVLIAALSKVVAAFAAISLGHAYVAGFPGWMTAGYYAWLGLLVWRLRKGRNVTGIVSAGLILTVAGLAWVQRPMFPPGGRAAMIDVGQGLCVVVQSPGGGTLLYDCGAYGRPEEGGRSMAPALWALGVRRIDTLAVSHAHADHFNALPGLARRFPIGRILTTKAALAAPSWAPAEVMRGEIPMACAAAEDRLDLGGGAVAEVLHPPDAPVDGKWPDPNNASLCLRVLLPTRRAELACWGSGVSAELAPASGRLGLLLTGDLEGKGAALLLASGREAASEVLVVPHHGGVMGPLGPFLQAVHPREAWVSAREEFPSPATLSGLAAGGATVRETWKEGAILLEIQP